MDTFLKQKVITPKVPSSVLGNRNQSKIVGTAKKSATPSLVDAGATPRTEKKIVDTSVGLNDMLKRRKDVTPPRTSSSGKRKGSSGKKKLTKTSKQAAFMANFFGAKKTKKGPSKEKSVVHASPNNTTKSVARSKNDAALAVSSIGPECKTKGVTAPSVCRKRPISALKSSPSASSPAHENGCAPKSGNKDGIPSIEFVAKKQKKLILHSDTTAQSPQPMTNIKESMEIEAKEPSLNENICDEEDDSEGSSSESSSDESGLEDAEELEDIDPELLKKHAEQKMRQVSITFRLYSIFITFLSC